MCSHSVVKLHRAAQIFIMVNYVRKIAVKKFCKYGEYELFEHLLFLLFYFFDFQIYVFRDPCLVGSCILYTLEAEKNIYMNFKRGPGTHSK